MKIENALRKLREDPVMSSLVDSYPPPNWMVTKDLFSAIVQTVAGQQLSVKAAAAIISRLFDLFPGRGLTPEAVLAVSEDELREAGMSWAKVRSIRDLATAVSTGDVDLESLKNLPDEKLRIELYRFRGIGPWTADMLLIFDLDRPDIFSAGDLGLRTAVGRLYHVDREDIGAINAIAEEWTPYRSYACHYLWKSLDNAPR